MMMIIIIIPHHHHNHHHHPTHTHIYLWSWFFSLIDSVVKHLFDFHENYQVKQKKLEREREKILTQQITKVSARNPKPSSSSTIIFSVLSIQNVYTKRWSSFIFLSFWQECSKNDEEINVNQLSLMDTHLFWSSLPFSLSLSLSLSLTRSGLIF